MARGKKSEPSAGRSKRKIEQYDHRKAQRKNNPPVGLVTEATDRDTAKKQYQYDPHLDPALTWAGKAEHTSFEVPTVSLHVHERIDPKTIIEAVRRRNGTPSLAQGSLFESAEENPPLREAIDFYQHAHAWSNRLIAGDSLLVMNSLLEVHGFDYYNTKTGGCSIPTTTAGASSRARCSSPWRTTRVGGHASLATSRPRSTSNASRPTAVRCRYRSRPARTSVSL